MKKTTVLYLLAGIAGISTVALYWKHKAYDRGYEEGKSAGYRKGREDGLQDAMACYGKD